MNNVKLTETIVKIVNEIIGGTTTIELTEEIKELLFDGVLKIINEQVH